MNELNDWIQKKSSSLEGWCRQQNLRSNDALALQLLQPLLGGRPFLPFSQSALRPFCLLHVVNDVCVNNRRKLLEFGAGISTIVLARALAQQGRPSSLHAIEHDREWLTIVRSMLEREGLQDQVTLIHAPLAPCSLAVDGNLWFDTEVLDSALDDEDYDLVLIDGPPAYETDKQQARYPSFPYTARRLAEDASIYLDDCDRPGEQAVARKWESEYAISFGLVGGSLGCASLGESLTTLPFAYG